MDITACGITLVKSPTGAVPSLNSPLKERIPLEKCAVLVVRGAAGGSEVSENLPCVSVSTAAKSR